MVWVDANYHPREPDHLYHLLDIKASSRLEFGTEVLYPGWPITLEQTSEAITLYNPF